MNNQFEFKVGDKVKIMFYNKEYDIFWNKKTIGDTAVVRFKYEDGCVYLSNGYVYHPSELQIVQTKQSKDNLTQAELQYLTGGLSIAIREVEENIFFYKGKVAHTWKYCIPNSSEAYLEFPRLNSLKDALRKEKETLKKLSEIQRKLKKQQGN